MAAVDDMMLQISQGNQVVLKGIGWTLETSLSCCKCNSLCALNHRDEHTDPLSLSLSLAKDNLM